ncbi:MAG: MFS transporter [Pseudomonadota bacterium]
MIATDQQTSIRAVLPIACAMFSYVLGLGMLVPSLPFIVRAAGGDDFAAAAILAVFSSCAILSSPCWGFLSDRIGRKPALILAALGTAGSYVILALAETVTEIYLGRALAGLSAGWLVVSQAFIADITTPALRTRAMGVLGAAFGLGFTIGPLTTALVLGRLELMAGFGPGGVTILAAIAGSCALIGLVIVLLVIREPAHKHAPARKVGMMALLAHQPLRKLFLMYGCVFFAFTAIEATYALWCARLFGFGAGEVGLLLGLGGLTSVIIQGGLLGRLQGSFGERRLIIMAQQCMIIALIVMALLLAIEAMTGVQAFLAALLPMVLLACTMSLHNPVMQSLISRTAPDAFKGSALGAAQACASFARIISPIWAGFVYAYLAPQMVYIIALMVFAIPAIMLSCYGLQVFDQD